jgi:hypothetical protein
MMRMGSKIIYRWTGWGFDLRSQKLPTAASDLVPQNVFAQDIEIKNRHRGYLP